MKLGVIAGTLYDTEMGYNFFRSQGFDTVSAPMCSNCIEQSNMQYFNKNELEELFMKKALMLKERGADVIIIYCNSLSSAIDYKSLEKKQDLRLLLLLRCTLALKDIKAFSFWQPMLSQLLILKG